jgi:hypothetical protein
MNDKWIDVKTKPNSGVEVLGVIAVDDASYIEIVVYDDRDSCWQKASGGDVGIVTHWQLLPELP